LVTQAIVWYSRYRRAQGRLLHNRFFMFKGEGHKEKWVPNDTWTYKPLFEGDLLKMYMEDHHSAKNPKMAADDVTPLSLSQEQLDFLLSDLLKWKSNIRK